MSKHKSKDNPIKSVGVHRGVPEYSRPNKPVGWKQFKEYRKGYKAAKKGAVRTDCPYQLTEEMKEILVKRDKWLCGWEDWTYSTTANKHRKKDVERESRSGRKRRKK